jgi:hypothetical protein
VYKSTTGSLCFGSSPLMKIYVQDWWFLDLLFFFFSYLTPYAWYDQARATSNMDQLCMSLIMPTSIFCFHKLITDSLLYLLFLKPIYLTFLDCLLGAWTHVNHLTKYLEDTKNYYSFFLLDSFSVSRSYLLPFESTSQRCFCNWSTFSRIHQNLRVIHFV